MAASPVLAGQLLAGRYRLVRELAKGGMAEVWEATDELLGRQVAVKILLDHLADDPAFVARFRREGQSAARLSHPNVVRIYDTCHEHHGEAIVMELLQGPTLRQALDERGPLSVAEATEVGAQVAAALSHAHHHGLVHRDVKPANIVLAPDGRVVVTDFGIAKAAETDADLTEVGQVVGTAKYLSPEQLRGGSVDGRSDVYSLGVVLYEAVCGQPPFAGSGTAVALARLTSPPEPLRSHRPDIPPWFEATVLRAMAREPEDRYRSAAELQTALLDRTPGHVADATTVASATSAAAQPHPARVLPTTPSGPAPPPRSTLSSMRRTRRPEWWATAVTVTAVAVVLGLVLAVLARTEPGRDLLDRIGLEEAAPAQSVPVIDSRSFDPLGDGAEHPEDTGAIADDRSATTWSTEEYLAPLAQVKRSDGESPGVGLVVVIAGVHALDRVTIETPDSGWSATVYVSETTSGAIERELSAWGSPVATISNLSAGTTDVELGGTAGQSVLVWITDLGPPNSAGAASVVIAELSLWS